MTDDAAATPPPETDAERTAFDAATAVMLVEAQRCADESDALMDRLLARKAPTPTPGP